VSTIITGLAVGGLFGAALVLAALADPDKIIGTLRLKDFHAMRTIVVFVLVGMLGTWVLELLGLAHFDIKPAAVASVLVGGALLGTGFGLTGFCPGTGLACAASGRIDALVTVIGMFLGALVFILIYPKVVLPLENIANYGKTTLPEITGIPKAVWVIPIAIIGFLVLFLTRAKKPATS
jgi:uncharacterized membrane protein YedE/YeeE